MLAGLGNIDKRREEREAERRGGAPRKLHSEWEEKSEKPSESKGRAKEETKLKTRGIW